MSVDADVAPAASTCTGERVPARAEARRGRRRPARRRRAASAIRACLAAPRTDDGGGAACADSPRAEVPQDAPARRATRPLDRRRHDLHGHGRAARRLAGARRIRRRRWSRCRCTRPRRAVRPTRLGHRLGRAGSRALSGRRPRRSADRPCTRADDEAGRRLALDGRHDGHRLASRTVSKVERDGRRASPAPPRRRTARAPARASGGTGAARPRGRQIEHRDDVAGREAARARRTPAHAHVHGRGGSPTISRLRRDVLELERHAQRRARRPARRRRPATAASASASDSTFSPRCRNGMVGHQRERAPRGARAARAPLQRRAPQPRAQLVGVEAALDLPVERRARCCPVSSDTTIATASFSSVRPIAARWRDPSSRLEPRIHRQRQEAGRRRDRDRPARSRRRRAAARSAGRCVTSRS